MGYFTGNSLAIGKWDKSGDRVSSDLRDEILPHCANVRDLTFLFLIDPNKKKG